eukprot:scaffold127242_cov25-Tisochrysis_lutea.AAC.1
MERAPLPSPPKLPPCRPRNAKNQQAQHGPHNLHLLPANNGQPPTESSRLQAPQPIGKASRLGPYTAAAAALTSCTSTRHRYGASHNTNTNPLVRSAGLVRKSVHHEPDLADRPQGSLQPETQEPADNLPRWRALTGTEQVAMRAELGRPFAASGRQPLQP